MFKKIVVLTVLTLSAILLLPTAAHASQYVTTDSYSLSRPSYYHNRDVQTHYLWNQQHTAKLHNTKYFPHTTWVAQKTALLQHGTHVARYYYVVSKNKRTAGWIWHGFLKSGTYRKQVLTTDGLSLSTALNATDQNQLEVFAIKQLQKDGYENNNHLAMMYDYYRSNHLTPEQMSMAAVIQLVRIKNLDADKITTVNLPAITNLAAAIDPQHHNAKLETMGQGQLGLKIVASVEKALVANHDTTYVLYPTASGNLTNGQISFTLYLYE
ncbi:hypothetical protein [Levilactobacillus mulengensis]|uniref:hypothetical protein n=1 Tax=Levilactobacillus mulengensis TaxID=2486025 RepID=UPI000F771123|nr:hypothetical protein [Levilactobacillus mulengensis]